MSFNSIVPQISFMLASNNLHRTIMNGYRSSSIGYHNQSNNNNKFIEDNKVMLKKERIIISDEENNIIQHAKKILGDQ